MKFVSVKDLYNTIKLNAYKVKELRPAGLIGIPRSGMLAATLLSEETHVGVCSVNEFMDNAGSDQVFYRHGNRTVEHADSNVYVIVEDSVYNGSMLNYVMALKKTFPTKMFVSLAIYLEGPCKIYQPEIWFKDIRREVLSCNPPVAFYEWNLLDNYYNNLFLYDLDGVMCVDPPADNDAKAYEDYLRVPKALHIPITPSGNPIDICTYRLSKYEHETREFLKNNKANVGKLIMFLAATKEVRDLTPPAVYKAEHYKDNKYVLFIESNDEEAQQICKLSGKPVYCYQTGRMYKMQTN